MTGPSFWGPMYNAIYNSPIAVDATLTTAGGDELQVRAVDKTLPVPFLGMGGVEFQASRPFAFVQGGQLQMSGKIWSVKSFEYYPSPEGIAAGELRLILQGGANVG
jgi:hypothetical protein